MSNIKSLVKEIKREILQLKFEKRKVFATSSFQTQSAVLLHILSNIDADIPIYFINTGYHFPQTLEYKKQLTNLLHLNVIDLWPGISKSEQRNSNGELLYTSDPDRCCYYNKVLPLEGILGKYDIWISGVRRDQTEVRKNMQKTMQGPHGITRYHPMLNWSGYLIVEYIKEHALPSHPLALYGDNIGKSIGCEPCTQLGKEILTEEIRAGRWTGLKKTECGLHTELGVSK